MLHLCCFQCVIVELVKPGQSRREPLMSGERHIGKDSDAGRDWGQEEKGMTEDEMARWHH